MLPSALSFALVTCYLAENFYIEIRFLCSSLEKWQKLLAAPALVKWKLLIHVGLLFAFVSAGLYAKLGILWFLCALLELFRIIVGVFILTSPGVEEEILKICKAGATEEAYLKETKRVYMRLTLRSLLLVLWFYSWGIWL